MKRVDIIEQKGSFDRLHHLDLYHAQYRLADGNFDAYFLRSCPTCTGI